jgi:hypothetical protein
MQMEIVKSRMILFVLAITVMAIATTAALAQKDTTPKKRLSNPASVSGTIGGESHSGYVIHARKGQTLSVQISWRKDGDNRAEFTVSRSGSFFNGGQVKFGRSAEGGRRWTGRLPATGDYYIYVVGHPIAKYTLRVTVK